MHIMEWISLKNTNNIGIDIINIHYDIASVMFATETATATETETETAHRATHKERILKDDPKTACLFRPKGISKKFNITYLSVKCNSIFYKTVDYVLNPNRCADLLAQELVKFKSIKATPLTPWMNFKRIWHLRCFSKVSDWHFKMGVYENFLMFLADEVGDMTGLWVDPTQK